MGLFFGITLPCHFLTPMAITKKMPYRLLEVGVTHRKFYIIPDSQYEAIDALIDEFIHPTDERGQPVGLNGCPRIPRGHLFFFHATEVVDHLAAIDFLDAIATVYVHSMRVSSMCLSGGMVNISRVRDEVADFVKRYEKYVIEKMMKVKK